MSLTEQLQITPGDCVAVVGAGGKTTLCWRLVQQLASRGARVIFTTTTHVLQPAPGAFDILSLTPESDLSTAAFPWLPSPTWHTACIASAIIGAQDDTPVAESNMPVVNTRLKGFTAEAICQLRTSISIPQSPISLIVEADGARGRWLKAPAEYEPVIPPCANVVCVVANLSTLGQPLDEHVAHRPERIATLTGAQMGQPITPQIIIDVLCHPFGGLKGIPPGARKVAVLTHHTPEKASGKKPGFYEKPGFYDLGFSSPDATAIASALTSRGFDQAIVLGSNRAGEH
jgi:probable selenium-dependent hydroxylase accessory protein YqeC